jgi:HlyD family secretion protein
MRIVLILILLLTALATGWFSRSVWDRRQSGSTTDVQRQPAKPPQQLVRGIGKLEPQSGIIKIFGPQGQKVDSLFSLQVGSRIEVNQPLVQLSGRQLRELELKLAQAKKIDAENQLAAEVDQGQKKKDASQLAIDEARTLRNQVEAKSQSIHLLESQMQIAERQLNRMRNLRSNPLTQNMVGLVDLEKQTLLVDQLSTQIEQTRIEVEQGTERAARAEKAAQIDLETVDLALRNSSRAVPFESLEAAIEAAQAALDMTIIKSPIGGEVLDIVVRPGDAITTQPIMLVGDTNQIVCVAEINDVFLRNVAVEDRAVVRSTAFTETLSGRVISKGVMIGPPSLKDPNPFGSVDRKTGQVVILVDEAAIARNFISLEVNVEIDVADNALDDRQ